MAFFKTTPDNSPSLPYIIIGTTCCILVAAGLLLYTPSKQPKRIEKSSTTARRRRLGNVDLSDPLRVPSKGHDASGKSIGERTSMDGLKNGGGGGGGVGDDDHVSGSLGSGGSVPGAAGLSRKSMDFEHVKRMNASNALQGSGHLELNVSHHHPFGGPSIHAQYQQYAPNRTVGGLDPELVRNIAERLLDLEAPEAPEFAFGAGVVGGAAGRLSVSQHKGVTIRSATTLPPFHAQIHHLISQIRTHKQPRKPLLLEGPQGLGKGTALQQWVSEEGAQRPAVYLQLSQVLRKRHGGSSMEDDDEEEEGEGYFNTETETELEGLEERVRMTVRRDAWIRAVEKALGVSDEEAMMIPLPDNHFDESASEDTYRHTTQVDLTLLSHVAQALRLIASQSPSGPVLLVIDDIQLLFHQRLPLWEKYDGIPEVLGWLLRADQEGILDVVFCSSEKSAVGAIKRLKGFDWNLTLHSLDPVDDDTCIQYLLQDVNPIIKMASRKFTPATAALFVATFDGSLLELDNYIKDGRSNIYNFITKRERSFLRHLQRHLPTRNTPPTPTPTSSTLPNIPYPSTKRPSALNNFHAPYPLTTPEDELKSLFLDIVMRNGVLPVAQLEASRMKLVEALVERNILRWRDGRARRREGRGEMRGDWVLGSREGIAGGLEGGDEGEDGEGEGGELESLEGGSGGALGGDVGGVGGGVGHNGSGTGVGAASSSRLGGIGRVFGLSRRSDPDQTAPSPSTPSSATSSSWWSSKPTPSPPPPTPLATQPPATEDLTSSWAHLPHEDENMWGSHVPAPTDPFTISDLDASEQLAVFARERAELVWANNLVRRVCEAFVNGTTLQW
ncbi:hypothetical protein HDV05_000367 [Chytridiales sp. JEL 0842]|nr:hypothetical protein HDV05_000367 [Chytridiales sp. JEL 0842]